jgi:hypothetical protein
MIYQEEFQQALQELAEIYSPGIYRRWTENSGNIFDQRRHVHAQLKQLLQSGKELLAGDTLTPEQREEISRIVPTRWDYPLTHEYHNACEAWRKYKEEVGINGGDHATWAVLQLELDRTSRAQESRMKTVFDLTAAVMDDVKNGWFGHRLERDAILAFLATDPFESIPEAEAMASQYLFACLRHMIGSEYLYGCLQARELQYEADLDAEEAAWNAEIAERADNSTSDALAVVQNDDSGYTALQQRIRYLYQTRDQDPKAADGELRFLSTAARLLMSAARFRQTVTTEG